MIQLRAQCTRLQLGPISTHCHLVSLCLHDSHKQCLTTHNLLCDIPGLPHLSSAFPSRDFLLVLPPSSILSLLWPFLPSRSGLFRFQRRKVTNKKDNEQSQDKTQDVKLVTIRGPQSRWILANFGPLCLCFLHVVPQTLGSDLSIHGKSLVGNQKAKNKKNNE